VKLPQRAATPRVRANTWATCFAFLPPIDVYALLVLLCDDDAELTQRTLHFRVPKFTIS
jgi:hypothetical protein